jgi:hypothetical protein
MEIREILTKLITHEINIDVAEAKLRDIINGFRYKKSIELEIKSVSYGAETDTGYLHLKGFNYHQLSSLKAGDKVDIIKVY